MKKAACIFTICLLSIVALLNAQDYPNPGPSLFVSDYAHLLPADVSTKLLSDLQEFNKKASIEVAVVTIPSLMGQNIETYTRNLAAKWKVGKAGLDNGVMLLIAPNERKVRIEVARGAQPVLTNDQASQIISATILPQFKAGQMAEGIVQGTHAIMATFTPAEQATSRPPPLIPFPAPPQAESTHPSEEDSGQATGIFLLIVISVAATGVLGLIVTGVFSSKKRDRKAKYDFFDAKSNVRKELFVARHVAQNPDVPQKYKDRLEELTSQSKRFRDLTDDSADLDWIDLNNQITPLVYAIEENNRAMQQAKSLAQKSRAEGPGLLKSIPRKINEAKEKISKGKESAKANALIDEAKSKHDKAIELSSTNQPDWVVIYLLLSTADKNCIQAESTHHSFNQPVVENHPSSSYSSTSSSYSNSSSSSSSSDNSFGGGGGFDGGGSSGSW
ncbi:TPM domain-containing protein [Candidatus Parcubacteria bacterium]|nr:TPM domain-containing protein [Candidatus Parcubacteria bacterium]